MTQTSLSSGLDLDRLLRLRLTVARHGEMDAARWWNSKGMLGRYGAVVLKRGCPSTHYFAQARVVFAVARHRCAELFDPPGCMTLWHLPSELEDQFEERWQTWLDEAERWTPFFEELAGLQGDDLLDALKRRSLRASRVESLAILPSLTRDWRHRRSHGEISTRLIRKGALISETRDVLSTWDFDRSVKDNLHQVVADHVLHAKSEAWMREMVVALSSRFSAVPPHELHSLGWLARAPVASDVWQACLLWHIGRVDTLYYEFAVDWLFQQFQSGIYLVRTEDCVPFVQACVKRQSRHNGDSGGRAQLSLEDFLRVVKMTEQTIKDLFANRIDRRIEEVIKVDQADEHIVRDELDEYMVTDSIRSHFTEILERYWETPKKPHEGIAVWVSGFFGSGKSSFAKYLGLALENRAILGEGAAHTLGQRTGDSKVQVLLNNISEQIPTNAVIFDVFTDRGIRTGNQTLTEIMYRLFLQSLGYARDLDLSELEITLQEEVLNFIEYLLFKIEHEATRQEASDWSTLSLTHAMRGMEDEDAPPYTLEDLQEQFS